jgi:hypothetical protein
MADERRKAALDDLAMLAEPTRRDRKRNPKNNSARSQHGWNVGADRKALRLQHGPRSVGMGHFSLRSAGLGCVMRVPSDLARFGQEPHSKAVRNVVYRVSDHTGKYGTHKHVRGHGEAPEPLIQQDKTRDR